MVMMYFIGATIISSGVFGSPNTYSLVENVTCSGGGSNFSACDFSLAGDCIPYCPNSNVGIRCFSKSLTSVCVSFCYNYNLLNRR